MRFHNFFLKYKESDEKLRYMLKNATVAVDEAIEHKPNIVDVGEDLKQQQQVKFLSDFEETSVLIKPEKSLEDDVDVDTKQFIPKLTIPADPIAVKWECSKCLSEFQTRRLLENHSKNHLFQQSETEILTSRKQHECRICLDKFPSRKMLQKHKREHFQKQTDEYECDICNKKFNTKNKIAKHMTTHTNEGRRKFLCVACGKQFLSKFGLTQHISAIHDKEQRFQCTKCSRRFAHKHNLKTHMNRHNGVRPYACTVCTKTFYDSSTLNVHTKSVHSDKNAYVCSICSKGFNRNGNLKIHMVKTHHIQHTKIQGVTQLVKMKVKREVE